MADYSQVLLCLFLITVSTNLSKSASDISEKVEEKEDLIGTETRDGKLEIIKKIKKINNDGSYTIGYEADDGSFKIESRDVLGQIKGTYGFVDENGQIKRVSYTTSNASEIINSHDSPTVVQRIPSRNKTTTKRPTYFSSSFPSTSPIPTTPGSSIQSIARRRTSSSTTSTSRPNTNGNQYETTTVVKPNYVTYTSAPPRVLLQGQPSQASQAVLKSEGQIIRPEVVTIKPRDSQLTNVLRLKNLDVEKPVHEETEPEIRSNILRRQLSPQNSNQNYDVRAQLQQSLGHDSSDIYTNSMSTTHPKPPLFTTTSRPRPIITSSTTPYPVSVVRPVVPYPEQYQSRSPQELYQQHEIYSQETTTTRPQQQHSTSTTLPVVQIPPNKPDESGHLIAFRHPSQGDTILVPLGHVHGKLIPIDQLHSPNDDQRQFFYQGAPQNTRVIEIEQQKAIVRRLPPPSLRPIPVKVDDTGHIKDSPPQVAIPYPYPVPVNAAVHSVPINNINLEPTTKYVETEIENDIDHIQPPVSTKDFQKLLEQLIIRQSRLEKVSMLTRHPEVIAQQITRARPTYPQQAPIFYRKSHISEPRTQIAYIPNPQAQIQRPLQRILNVDDGHRHKVRFQPQDLYIDPYENQAYRPMRRIARLQPSIGTRQLHLDEENKVEYLPPNVREMLLLRMLQLAINPALPIDENDIEIEQTTVKKKPVRNVEILGEEVDISRTRSDRIKRYPEEKYR